MSERTLPSTGSANRDIPGVLWRALVSPKMASLLLILLAIAVLLTLLFSPQHPGPSADTGELSRWTSDAQIRFGSWYDVLMALGVFNIGAAAWLHLLLGWSALSLMVSLADRMAQTVRAWRQSDARQPESFFKAASSLGEWHVSQERASLLESLTRQLAWPVRLPWRWLQIPPRRQDVGRVSYLYQDWLTWRWAMSLLIHLGLLLVLTSVVLNARLGWRREGVILMSDQAVPLGGLSDLSLRLKSVDESEVGGRIVSWVALDSPDGTSWAGTVAVGQPYTTHGVSVYQHELGPVLRVSARGGDGSTVGSDGTVASILLEDASAEMEPADEIRLMFTESRVEQYVLMPYIQKAMRLVLYRRGERWDPHHDELQVEIYARNLNTPEAAGSIVGSGPMKLGGIVYEFTWERYAIFDVVCTSYQWLVRIGMGLALLGLIATFLVPSARLWVRVVEEHETNVVELAGEMSVKSGSLDAWLASWRQRLGGDDASG